MRKIKTTKGQQKKLMSQHVGTGFLAIKTREGEMMEVEFYIGENGVICRISDGNPIFPIVCYDECWGELTAKGC